jgi:hypothetical protein
MANNTTTFQMFIHESDKKRLIDAIEHVNKDKAFSQSKGMEHYVDYKITKIEGGSVWFGITVSRPFLIFKIGERYSMNKTLNSKG